MMFWPSKMSLEPPPVTPRRKFPPRLGVPAAPPVVAAPGDEELLPHAAARPPATARPAAPEMSCRREIRDISVISGLSPCSPIPVLGLGLAWAFWAELRTAELRPTKLGCRLRNNDVIAQASLACQHVVCS